MASTIASPMPRSQRPYRSLPKDILQPTEEGRGTPLPQYEKTQSVPFTLTLQEEKDNPGKFQLVVNIDPQHQKAPEGSSPKPASSKKLVANLQEAPSLGFDVSQLYQTLKSSPPSSPHEERQGWSELDAIPPEFLQKVVPDWKVTFSRSDSSASTQSKKLADIKARIKKSGKGFVVRLLRGSSSENSEEVEVPLGQATGSNGQPLPELDSEPPLAAELDAVDHTVSPNTDQSNDRTVANEIFEIGTSGEAGIQKANAPAAAQPNPSIASWLNLVNPARLSISEEGFSDADTLLPEIRSIAERVDEQTDVEPLSRESSNFPTRSGSVLSIVKTPTRGLSVIGPVRKVEKTNRVRAKGKAVRHDLNRSGAHLSTTRRRSSRHQSFETVTMETPGAGTPKQTAFRDTPILSFPDDPEPSNNPGSKTSSVQQHFSDEVQAQASKTQRRSSAEELVQPRKPKGQLRLRTDVPRSKSATSSPVSKRKRSPRTRKQNSISSSVSFGRNDENEGADGDASPLWDEVKPEKSSEDVLARLREACVRVADANAAAQSLIHESVPLIDEAESSRSEIRNIPLIEEPATKGQVGDFAFGHELEIRTTLSSGRSPTSAFWGLVVSSLANKAIEILTAFSDAYGSEPPVPPGHVRVHWTCTCGEPLYDDFVEHRAGAARALEAYLNRPRAHTPTSPSSRSTTYDSRRSLFDSASRASTLATPASTYGNSFTSKKSGSLPKMYPTRVQDKTPAYVRIAEESWLLTCANEGRFTPKIVHLDVNEGRILSDKDLALELRDHYDRLNRRWFRWARLRGLSTIEFVQFEVHRNRFADIRASPSMPPVSSSENEKSPSQHPYTFESVGLVPPVGSAYLLHLFKHPEDYDGEKITYLRSPKRRARLDTGMGWGINLVEGFQAQKVWAIIMAFFGLGSGVFGIVWTLKKGDVQGAFGVAGWVVTLATLVVGSLQAWLD